MYFKKLDKNMIDKMAIDSLYETLYAFKPGLALGEEYEKSIDFLKGSFADFFSFGGEYSCVESGLCFDNLRLKGRAIENKMLDATGGVHTHIGALFALALMSCAAGKLDALGIDFELDYLITTVADYTRYYSYKSFINVGSKTSELTSGEKLYLKTGNTSIRGCAEQGFASELTAALEFIASSEHQFKEQLELLNRHIHRPINTTDSSKLGDSSLAMATPFITRLYLLLVSLIDDSRIILQHGQSIMSDIQSQSKQLCLAYYPDKAQLFDEYLKNNQISPKGAMTLLSLCLFTQKLLCLKK